MLNVHLTARADVTPELEYGLRRLLQRAYPQFADLWAGVSYWGSEPEYHLWLADRGRPVAQLGFGRRTVSVNGQEVQIAGVGAVCTDPGWQGRGVGKRLLTELQRVLSNDLPTDFGFLQCREAVAGFYERGGFVRVPQSVRFFDPDEQQWVLNAGPTMVLPVLKGSEAWPVRGEVDLRGLPW